MFPDSEPDKPVGSIRGTDIVQVPAGRAADYRWWVCAHLGMQEPVVFESGIHGYPGLAGERIINAGTVAKGHFLRAGFVHVLNSEDNTFRFPPAALDIDTGLDGIF